MQTHIWLINVSAHANVVKWEIFFPKNGTGTTKYPFEKYILCPLASYTLHGKLIANEL